MLKIRTIKSVYLDDETSNNNILDGLFTPNAQNYGYDQRISYINTGDQDVYIKTRNGIIKRIRGSNAMTQRAGIRRDLYEHLLIQKQTFAHIEDIAENVNLINKMEPEDRDEEHCAILNDHKQNLKNRAYEYNNLTRTNSSQIYQPRAPLYPHQQAMNVADYMRRPNGGESIMQTSTIQNYFKLPLSLFQGSHSSPVYVPYNDILVAYGPDGFEALKKVLHPKSKEHQIEYCRFLAKSTQNEQLFKSFCHQREITRFGEEVKLVLGNTLATNDTERFMYSIDLIDNDGKYPNLWCNMFGQVICIKPFSRPGVESGIYVTRTIQSNLSKSQSLVETKFYDRADEVPEIKLYTSVAQAEGSGEFRDAAEAELRINEQREKSRNVERQISLNTQKHEHDVRKMQDAIDTYNRDREVAQQEVLRVNLAHRREIEKLNQAVERERLAHERDLEKARIERENLLLKQETDRLKAAHDEKAARAKLEQDIFKFEQERESYEIKRKFEQESHDAKMKQERKSGGLKIIVELSKYVPQVFSAAYKLIKKFSAAMPSAMPA